MMRLLLAVTFSTAVALAPASPVQGERPTTLKLVSGSVEIRNVTYTQGTPPSLTSPASGQGELVVRVSEREFTKPGVSFTNLLSDAAGNVTGISGQMASPFVMQNVLGSGSSLEIPAGQLGVTIAGRLSLSAAATLSLPFRTSKGTFVQASVRELRGEATASGVKLLLQDMTLNGDAAQEGLTFPGFKMTSAPLAAELDWGPQRALKWALKVPSARVHLGIPGVPTDPDHPFTATVTDLVVTEDGAIAFNEVDLQVGGKTRLTEGGGFEIVVKGGKVRMVDSMPVFTAVRVDLTLPPGISENVNGSTNRATINDLQVQVDGGLIVEASSVGTRDQRFRLQGMRFAVTAFGLDLSNTKSLAGSSGDQAQPTWTGLVVKSGTLEVPVGADILSLSCKDFVVEPQGLTGTVTLAPGERQVGGLTLKESTGAFELKRNLLVRADISGKVHLVSFGEIQASTAFDQSGNVTVAVGSDQRIQIASLGVKIEKLKARLASGMLALSGQLGFDAQRIQGIPEGMRQFSILITDLRVDRQGNVHLPSEGYLTFPSPKPLDVGPLSVEVRRVGFTTQNNAFASILFSGSAELKGMGDALPMTGGLDLEGLRIRNDGGTPKFEMGGLGFKSQILGIGSFSASLTKLDADSLPVGTGPGQYTPAQVQNIRAFGPHAFAGDASLTLTCLPVGNVGIGLEFLVAPNLQDPLKSAFFIGGNVLLPAPILVQIPNPPVPLFHIMGFSGGLGINVTSGPGQGRINDPMRQLRYGFPSGMLQVGLLLADPVPGVPGHLWWADATLTGTLNPTTLDITAKAAFLDPGRPQFYPDPAQFDALDRIATVYMNLDLSTPALTIGGQADLTFPTRSMSLFNASGEAQLRVSPSESYLRVGWKDAGQKPLKVTFGQVFSNIAEITAECGLEVVMPAINLQGRVTRPAQAGMFFDASAKFDVPGASIHSRILGSLALQNVGGTSGFSASGNLGLGARIDFGLFEAQCEGSLSGQFNTPAHPNRLHLAGTVSGKVGPVERSARIALTLPAKAS
jgi:hypothetical protein